MDRMPTISVVIATYNGAQWIDQQLNSIVNQLDADDEVIVSDDHSTDSTVEQINALNDSRIRVVFPATRLGPAANFEYGLKHSKNDVIVLSDQDDVWLPRRIQVIRSYFGNSDAPFDLLMLNSRVVNERLETIQPSVFRWIDCGPGLFKNIYRNTYIGCHLAFRRHLLSVAMPFPKRIPMHDVWLGLVSELSGVVTFRDETTMLFRRTGSNFTRVRYSWRRRVIWRLNLILELFKFVLFRRRNARLSPPGN